MFWNNVPRGMNPPALVNVVVETPLGSRIKYSAAEEHGAMVVSKLLATTFAYPANTGFFAQCWGEDGDPLDAMVLHDAATWPGLVIRCRVIGAVKVVQRERKGPRVRNDRLMVVPEEDHRGEELKDARRLPKAMRTELEKFFAASVALKHKELEFLGWVGAKDATKLIRAAEAKWREKHGG